MEKCIFKKSDWIWNAKENSENEYSEFYDSFIYNGKATVMRISVCGDYTLFINGKYVSSNQYADFEQYKIYDEIDISEFLKKGENIICFLVWYYGKSGMRYKTLTPGLIYEVICEDEILSYSSMDTLSRQSRAYISGDIKKISPQLGYSFYYDAVKEDKWICGEATGFSPSYKISKGCNFYPRPIKKHDVKPIVKGQISKTNKSYIIDLGEELVGMPSFCFTSECEQKINISYGEILENGRVKRILGSRDFSFEYNAKMGVNEYTNYMFRVACRYMEVECEFPIDIEFMGVFPQMYPVKERENIFLSELDKQIYDICVNTLRLCMMEHYVDCPWREQCLYAFDSRNQMLAGYKVFEDGNFEYARANLLLMSKDDRKDDLLSICFPSGEDLTIPSFSLWYIVAVKEYLMHSGDKSLCEEVFDKMECILKVFVNNMKDGFIYKFEGEQYWDFYDWSPYADGSFDKKESGTDFLINCIAVIALDAYGVICRELLRENIFDSIAKIIKEKAGSRFCNKKTGMFFISSEDETTTELANCLAVISGIADGETAEKICAQLAAGSFIESSLSMKAFKYDAMILVDKAKYNDTILGEIRETYRKMLDEGSTTVWETIDGAKAFDNAGSLCHGWSAIPVYYYDLYKMY